MAASHCTESSSNIRVKDVCKEFLLKADELLACKLQDEEYHEHYDKNRKKSQHIRNDLPVAKSIQNSEYEELLKRHEFLERIEKEDALMAMSLQEQMIEEARQLQLQRHHLSDADQMTRLGTKLSSVCLADTNDGSASFEQDDYILRLKKEQEDLSLAKYLQEQEDKKILIQAKIKEKSRELIALNDERIARMLQEQEEKEYKELIKKQQQQQQQQTKQRSKNYESQNQEKKQQQQQQHQQKPVNGLLMEAGLASMQNKHESHPVPILVQPIQPIIKSNSLTSSSSSLSSSSTNSLGKRESNDTHHLTNDIKTIETASSNELGSSKKPKRLTFNLSSNVQYEIEKIDPMFTYSDDEVVDDQSIESIRNTKTSKATTATNMNRSSLGVLSNGIKSKHHPVSSLFKQKMSANKHAKTIGRLANLFQQPHQQQLNL